MSTSVTVSVKSPMVSLTVSAGSSTLIIQSNGQTIYNSTSSSSPPPPVPIGATLTFSGVASDSSGNPFANTVFYFFTQGPTPSTGTAPSPVSQSVTTDSKGNWSVTVSTGSMTAGTYNVWFDANPSGQ